MIAYLVKLMRELTQNITKERASKLDRLSNLDRSLSGVESTINRKIDSLVSSSQGNNPNLALSNLTSKIDALKQDVGTKSSQVSVTQLTNTANTLTSKIGTVETKVNQTNTTLETKANQNTVDAVANTANQINTALSNKASQASVNTLQSTANSIYSKLGTGSVKMVQRGEITGDSVNSGDVQTLGTNTFGVNITLPYSVNINKSIIFAECTAIVGYGSTYGFGVAGKLVSNNRIQLMVNVYLTASGSIREIQNAMRITWQVIEYY